MVVLNLSLSATGQGKENCINNIDYVIIYKVQVVVDTLHTITNNSYKNKYESSR